MKVKQEQVTIEAHDGACRAWLLGPEGDGQWPAVSVYMDALAIRPAMIELAATIAAAGYVVLLPDMFYRFGPYDTLDANTVLAQDFRTVLGPMMASVDNSKSALDTACFLEYLASLPQVRPGPVGTTGYCMRRHVVDRRRHLPRSRGRGRQLPWRKPGNRFVQEPPPAGVADESRDLRRRCGP